MSASEAQKRAIAKYEAEKVDRINARLPKGYKDEIIKTGATLNAYIIEAVKEKMIKDGLNVPN